MTKKEALVYYEKMCNNRGMKSIHQYKISFGLHENERLYCVTISQILEVSIHFAAHNLFTL